MATILDLIANPELADGLTDDQVKGLEYGARYFEPAAGQDAYYEVARKIIARLDAMDAAKKARQAAELDAKMAAAARQPRTTEIGGHEDGWDE